jgi:Ca2+-binding RTX toxin-like protein
MLDANEKIGWRDVQTILAYSARHVGSPIDRHTVAGSESAPWQWNDAKTWNGGGLHFSRDYGFGLVDALAAVRLAESWKTTSTSANQAQVDLTLYAGAPVTIGTAGMTFAASRSAILGIERVRVDIDFSTTELGDVEIYLVSPRGTTIKLLADLGQTNGNGRGSTDAFDGSWSFETQGLRGEEWGGPGKWHVRVVDDIPGGTTTVRSVTASAFGSSTTRNDTYVYTDAFSGFAGRAALADLDGGIDWLNASAVTSATIVRLDSGPSRIDGSILAVKGVENVYAGDGGDALYGSASANQLFGGRGDDKLQGSHGNDLLDGGAGNDRLDGGRHNDVLRGGLDADTLLGTSGNDSLFGDAGNDVLTGGTGRDNLTGGTGRDHFDFNTYLETGKTGSTRDVIKDFVRGYDKIDLSTIDANGAAARNGRFTFVVREDGDFTDTRGQLIWDRQNNAGTTRDRTIVSGDVNGDGCADFTIELTGLKTLTSSDFIL